MEYVKPGGNFWNSLITSLASFPILLHSCKTRLFTRILLKFMKNRKFSHVTMTQTTIRFIDSPCHSLFQNYLQYSERIQQSAKCYPQQFLPKPFEHRKFVVRVLCIDHEFKPLFVMISQDILNFFPLQSLSFEQNFRLNSLLSLSHFVLFPSPFHRLKVVVGTCCPAMHNPAIPRPKTLCFPLLFQLFSLFAPSVFCCFCCRCVSWSFTQDLAYLLLLSKHLLPRGVSRSLKISSQSTRTQTCP